MTLLTTTLFASGIAFAASEKTGTISQERYDSVCKWGIFNPPECKKKISKIKIKNFWVVRQFNNEYNPIHFHDGHISGVGYLKIPKFTLKNRKKSNIDGSIDFINGNRMLLSESIYNHQPRVGDMILFPHYLMHTAYPFKSNGERRSFSFNLEIDKKIANVFTR